MSERERERVYTAAEAQELEQKLGRVLKWIDVTTAPARPEFILAAVQRWPSPAERAQDARARVEQAEIEIRDAVMSAVKSLVADTGLKPNRINVEIISTGPSFSGDGEGEHLIGRVRLGFGA